MPRCLIQPATTVRLGNRVHHAPVIHVTSYSKAECEEETRDAKLCTPAMAWPQYGAFRKDFARRNLSPGAAADYLEAAAPAWPGYDFGPEIAYYRAMAMGERVCHACYAVLPPVPACDCGCQAPPRAVAGFASLGGCLLAPAVTAAAATVPDRNGGGPPNKSGGATRELLLADDGLLPAACQGPCEPGAPEPPDCDADPTAADSLDDLFPTAQKPGTAQNPDTEGADDDYPF